MGAAASVPTATATKSTATRLKQSIRLPNKRRQPKKTRLQTLREAEAEAMETLSAVRDELNSEELFHKRLRATQWYAKRRKLPPGELLSGWDSHRILLLQGRPQVDEQYLCPSGVGKWTRAEGETEYTYTF